MLTKKISIPTHTTILPNKVIKLCGLKHELKQLSFGDRKEYTLVFSTGGKRFLVMHANSAMFSLLSLLSNITFFLFSLLLLSTHYLDFLHIIFLNLCVLVPRSIFMGIQSTPIAYQPLPSNCVQVDSIPLRSFSLFLMTNNLPILGKDQFDAEPPFISFPKMVKASINSLCLHPLAHIRWFLLTFFLFFIKIFFQQSIFPKLVLARYQIQVISPFHQTTPSTPHRPQALLPCLIGMQKGRAQKIGRAHV